MDKRELIIPERFDHKDAVAGLKSIEHTGHVAGDLEHAADAASARFRQAHESIKLASQGYLELRRALRGDVDQERRSTAGGHTIDEAGEGGETNLTPKEWRESGDEFRSHAGGRFGGPMTSLPGEHTGEDRHAFYPPYDGAEHSPGQAQRPGSGMPASPDQERVAGGMAEFALAESRRRGLGGGSGLNEGMSRIDQAGNSSQEPQFREARSGGFGAFPDKNRGLGEDGESRGAVQGPAYQGIEPRESGWRGPLHREASVDLTGWARSDREGGRDGLTSPRRAATSPRTACYNATRRPSGMEPNSNSTTKQPPRASRRGRASGGCAHPSRPPQVGNSRRSRRRGPGGAPGSRRGVKTRAFSSAARPPSASSSGCSGSRTS